MRNSIGLVLGIAVTVIAATVSAWPGNPQQNDPSQQKPPQAAKALDLQDFQQVFESVHSGAKISSIKGASRIYGPAFSHGATAQASVDAFIQNSIPLFGISPDELEARASFLPENHPTGNTVPLMYDAATNSYKFTAFYYTQVRNGLDVYNARLCLVVRNEPGYPLVLASSDLRDVGGFSNPSAKSQTFNTGVAFAQARRLVGANAQISQPKAFLWTGVEEMSVVPRIAMEFSAEAINPTTGFPNAEIIIADAQTGQILYHESAIHDIDVTGNVSGMSTLNFGAAECNPEGLLPMPYARVAIGATAAFADVNGNFTIPNAGSSPVTVDAAVKGQFFTVINTTTPGGGNTLLSQTVTPPGPANFIFNDANTSEFKRAEVNTYINANVVRDFVLAQNPSYPTIATEVNFPANVNINQTCNAFYSRTGQSINFYISGGGCNNTSFSNVVHHEYGHRVVNAGGSGQGQFGEGSGDVLGNLIGDISCTGEGFQACGVCLREGNNTCQYIAGSGCSSCGSEIHDCGRLIAGAMWSTRNYMQAAYPGTYRQILNPLYVNSILVHGSGTGITPQNTIDILTLDDNDSNILNGTPHYNQINAGFSDHNMPGPALDVGISVSPSTHLVSSGLLGGPFTPSSINYTIQDVEDFPINYQVTHNQPWVSVSNASGTLPPHGSVVIVVSLNAAANSLANGVYSDLVTFTNLTNGFGNTTRNVSVEIGRIAYPSPNVPVPIPDLATNVTSNLTINDAYCVGDVDVEVHITHTYIGDLIVEIKNPQGTVVRLHNRTGGDVDNIDKIYSDGGTYPPDGPGLLTNFNNVSVNGTWQLKISDNAGQDSGTLNSWSLRIVPSGSVCPPVANTVTVTLPVVVQSNITLNGASTQGGSLAYIVTTLPAHGTLNDPNGGAIGSVPYTLLASGNVVKYLPAAAYNGTDTFAYKVNDGQDSNTASVNITVQPPVANSIAVTVPVIVTSALALSGTPSAGGPAVSYVIVSQPVHGTLIDPNGGAIAAVPYTLLSGGGTVNYKPSPVYAGLDSFTFRLNQGQNSNTATVSITVGGPQLAYNFNMDANPGWTTTGQWAWGHPTGGGSHSFDPANGFTGTNVYGYNLAGDYPNNLASIQYLTTTAINCSNMTGCELRFQRWLAVESATYDHANVQVSNNGTTWTDLFNHTGAALSPTAWSPFTYSISAVADGQSTVYIRWGMGVTDGSVTYPGWNIDDVQIWGIRPPCTADVTANGLVNVDDLLAVINHWGACAGCPADIAPPGGNGVVNVDDLLAVINAWGLCP